MNDDYLWDKSGEPDPEIQQLEQILGALRYQPRPLELPDDLIVKRRQNYFPLMAIAATFVIALLAAGLWWRTTSQKKPALQEVRVDQPASAPTINKQVDNKTLATDNHGPSPLPSVHRHKHQSPNVLASNTRRRSNSTPTLSPAQEKEAEDAKAQLLMALRLASEKLNLVQRKTQGGTAPPNQIRNQHKIG